MARVIVVTSGKGGVGKTTTSANIAAGLALNGFNVVVIDFDVGLRNLDLMMGSERRIIHDFINVVQGEASIEQALIADKNVNNLYLLASSQTRDKDDLNKSGVGKAIEALKSAGFDFIICDSPAGIEKGAQLALYFADEAIVVTNPEQASVRDADRMLGILQERTKRAEGGLSGVKEHLIVTRYQADRVAAGEMIAVESIANLLQIPFLGVVPEAKEAIPAANSGIPVILNQKTDMAQAYQDIVARLLGEEREHRFLHAVKKGFFKRLFS